MNKQQFIIMALFTAAETYFFNEAWMTGRYIMAAFWAILLFRNFRVSYVMGKIVDVIDQYFKRKDYPAASRQNQSLLGFFLLY
ncbi:DUF3272 domain-containing protein [Streptococcus pneumoniae]|uniref:DUF3272 domain-containing protein n=1 Tax=Streptococcus pneumoniae TaxID=1313 RepID=UPI000F64531D|nr:DUF3272 domain-containing protein [Streptococcus pneumoniae]